MTKSIPAYGPLVRGALPHTRVYRVIQCGPSIKAKPLPSSQAGRGLCNVLYNIIGLHRKAGHPFEIFHAFTRGEFLHHLFHLLKLPQQLIDLRDASSAAFGNP